MHSSFELDDSRADRAQEVHKSRSGRSWASIQSRQGGIFGSRARYFHLAAPPPDEVALLPV